MTFQQEAAPLLGGPGVSHEDSAPERAPSAPQLTMFFAMACIVDQFGVNPIIVLPRAIILCGWLGFPLAIAVFALTIYTGMLLGRCWVMAEHLDHGMSAKSRYPYTALTEMAWGVTAAKCINVFLNIAVFTSNIPALLIASQNLQAFDARVSNFQFNFSYCYWLFILGVALCPLTWLGSPRDMKWISAASSSCVLFVGILTWLSMLSDVSSGSVYRDLPSVSLQPLAVAFGILCFQLGCHPALLAIQADMKDKRQLSQSVFASFLVTGGLSTMTTLMAMSLYGAGVRANLTQGLPSGTLLNVDTLIVTLQLFLSTVVGGCALYQDIEDKMGLPRELCWQRCVVRSCVVMLAVLLGEILPRFDLVMGLLGGLLTGPITFIMPPLLYRSYRRMLARAGSAKLGGTRAVTEGTEPLIDPHQTSAEIPDTTRIPTEIPEVKYQLSMPTGSKLARFVQQHFFTLEVSLDAGDLTSLESFSMLAIVLIGLAATTTATFFSIQGAIWTAKFVPPCLFDVQAASNVINT